MKSEDHPKIQGLPASWQANLREKLRHEFGNADILLSPLRDESGVVAILPIQKDNRCNARIIEKSGATRCALEIPGEFRDGAGFYDAYYVSDELTAIFVTRSRDVAFVIDEESGRVIRSYETR